MEEILAEIAVLRGVEDVGDGSWEVYAFKRIRCRIIKRLITDRSEMACETLEGLALAYADIVKVSS